MELEIKENMVMLGKIADHPKWPCVIINEKYIQEKKPSEDEEWNVVQFFYNGIVSWNKKQDLLPYSPSMKNLNDKQLLKAIEEANIQLGLKEKDSSYIIKVNQSQLTPRDECQQSNRDNIEQVGEPGDQSIAKTHKILGTGMQNEITPQMIMWGKLKGFPHWPCVVIDEDEFEGELKPITRKQSAKLYPVHFFGDASSDWLRKEDLFDYNENREKFALSSQSRVFLRAICEADAHIRMKKENKNHVIEIEKKLRLRSKRRNHSDSQYEEDKKIKIEPMDITDEEVNDTAREEINDIVKEEVNDIIKEEVNDITKEEVDDIKPFDVNEKVIEEGPKLEITIKMIMWGKIIGYPPWPCIVLDKKECEESKKESAQYFVYFFTDNNCAWLKKQYLYQYEENREKFITRKTSKNKTFMRAISEADEHIKMQENGDLLEGFEQIKVKLENQNNKQIKVKLENQNNKQKDNKKIKKEPIKIEQGYKDGTIGKTVGIIGAGFIATEMAKKLLLSGYELIVCDVSYEKWEKLEKAYKEYGKFTVLLSPRAVLLRSEVAFLSLTDQNETVDIIMNTFESDNSEEKILQNRGVINITNVEPDVSIQLSKIIEKNGGKYLEVTFQGGKTEALNGDLILFTAGNESFLQECQPYLKAIGSNSYYFGALGYATKINLILQMIKSINIAVLGEGISLAENLGIPADKFIEIFNISGLSNDYFKIKSKEMVEKEFNKVNEPLDVIQRDLKLSLNMSDKILHPLSLANITNQMFQQCLKFQYGSYDASAIVMKNNHC